MDLTPRPRTRRGLRQTLLGVLTLLVAATGLLVTPLPAKAADTTEVLFLLDVSGSMNERISSGGTKFAAAQRALKRVADAVPAGTQVGLRVYGSEIAPGKEKNPKACTDTKLVLPIGPLDRGQLFRAVDSFQAKGETPIAYSMGKAVDDLGPSGKRVMILISDGEESCDGDPCPAARKLAKAGVDLQFNAIGLAVDSKARKQLQCIAKAGDGNYYDADNTTIWRTRSAGSPSGRCGRSRPAGRRWRARSTSRVLRRSGRASTRTPTTPATPRATTGSPAPRAPP